MTDESKFPACWVDPLPDIKSNAISWLEAGLRRNPLVNFIGEKWMRVVHAEDIALETAIEESKKLLELQPDWDEAGAPAIERTTWERATELLRSVSEMARQIGGTIIQAPRILPGPGGSIDLHWRTTRHELLVNVPADSNRACDFYGDNYGRFSLKGTFHPDEATPSLMMLLQ